MKENFSLNESDIVEIGSRYFSDPERTVDFPKVDRKEIDPEVYQSLVLTKKAYLNEYLPAEVAEIVFEVMLNPKIGILEKRDMFRAFKENGPWSGSFKRASNPGQNPGSIH